MMTHSKHVLQLFTFLIFFSACNSERSAPEKANADTGYGMLGTVNFPTSCNSLAAPHMNEGLALLHHMTYEDAHNAFASAAELDPDCGLSYWGQAMTYVHPLWPDQPTAEQFRKAEELLSLARNSSNITDREAAYVDALAAYMEPGVEGTEQERLSAFEKGWESAYHTYPDDVEVMALYALAHMATASPSDKSYEKQHRAGELAAHVLEQVPDHPGGHHYTIHAYDLPALANRALAAARNYGKIAPEVPHALHMPSHIFTRLGYWDESIEWNSRSAEAALNHPVGDKLSMHYLHALDYLAYAYLQQGKDDEARNVKAEMLAINQGIQLHAAAAYTMSAVPARLALERQAWDEAAALTLFSPDDFSWESFAPFEAITRFSQALGAAHTGNLDQAEKAVQRLDELLQKTRESNAYWATQIEVQYLGAQAWLAYAKGNQDGALELMQQSAALERTTEKHAITPGEVLPSVELLGMMLLELGQPAEAMDAFETALVRSPNRLNSLYGAGYAAELTGNTEQALGYYTELMTLTEGSTTELEQIAHARSYLLDNSSAE